jgi:S1-C subfamily serine protease
VINHPFSSGRLLDAFADCREFPMVLFARNLFLRKFLSQVLFFSQFGVLPGSLTSCKTKVQESASGSEVNIAGGVRATEHNYVVKLVMNPLGQTNSENQSICTGVFLDKKTVVTSAHCLQKRDGAAILPTVHFNLGDNDYTINSKTVVAYQDLVEKKQIPVEFAAYDLALVQVDCQDNQCPQDGLPFPTFALKSPASGEDVTLVGYGASSLGGKDGGVDKTIGNNKVNSTENNAIIVAAKESEVSNGQAIATYGDSGGPLLDKNGNLLGIGSSFTQESGEIRNYFSPLGGSGWQTLWNEYLKATSAGSGGYLLELPKTAQSLQLSGKKAETMFLLLALGAAAVLAIKAKQSKSQGNSTINVAKGNQECVKKLFVLVCKGKKE